MNKKKRAALLAGRTAQGTDENYDNCSRSYYSTGGFYDDKRVKGVCCCSEV